MGALSATFSPDGKRVLTSRIDVSYASSSMEDKIVDIWDAENGAEVRDFMGGRALGVVGRSGDERTSHLFAIQEPSKESRLLIRSS